LAVIALTSATGAPGVTTTCLALTLSWPRPVLLVEADPAGGDILAGFLRAEIRADRGLAYLALAARRDELVQQFPAQLVDLGPGKGTVTRLLLPGVSDPAESAGVVAAWPRLVEFLVRLGNPADHPDGPVNEPLDVVVDCGRCVTAHPPVPVLAGADAVLFVVRSTLRSVSGAAPVLAMLRRDVSRAGGDPDRIGLLVIEEGEYRSTDLGRALGAPVVATMPWRTREAAALSDGAGRAAEGGPLLRSAASTAEGLIREIARARAAGAAAQTVPYPSTPPGVVRR
jgi:hypothetical protein